MNKNPNLRHSGVALVVAPGFFQAPGFRIAHKRWDLQLHVKFDRQFESGDFLDDHITTTARNTGKMVNIPKTVRGNAASQTRIAQNLELTSWRRETPFARARLAASM